MSIPTTYNGVRFRSRLEARWACFFDLAKWRWEYEPVDLKGYIPDFFVYLGAAPVLVEVKPNWEEAFGADQKIEDGGWAGDRYVVLNSSLSDIPIYAHNVGLIARKVEHEGEFFYGPDDAVLFCCAECGRATITGETTGNCLFCGYWPSDFGCIKAFARGQELYQWWIEAGNEVQWRKR